MSKPFAPFLIGIAGGSCAGKTTLAQQLQARLGTRDCLHLEQDRFYADRSELIDLDRGLVNFDHPESLDFALLESCLGSLLQGRAVDLPRYDFVTHRRLAEVDRVDPKPWIILEGTLVLHPPTLRRRLDLSLFLDCPPRVQEDRRLDRDKAQRGRSTSGITRQYHEQVQPMHFEFVEPTGDLADHRLPFADDFDLDGIMRWIRAAAVTPPGGL